MSRTRTRLQIRDGARARADTVGDENVSDTACNYQIDQALARLWGKLTRTDAKRYATSATVSATSGTLTYSLPADFQATFALDLEVSATERYPVEPFMWHERSFGSLRATGGDPWCPVQTRYTIFGQGISGSTGVLMFDTDPGTRTYRHWYIQAPQLLTSDVSTFDGVAGWEDWIELTVAIWMCGKQERDTAWLQNERAMVEAEIMANAPLRDAGRASRVQDTAGRLGTRPYR